MGMTGGNSSAMRAAERGKESEWYGERKAHAGHLLHGHEAAPDGCKVKGKIIRGTFFCSYAERYLQPYRFLFEFKSVPSRYLKSLAFFHPSRCCQW